MNTRRSIFRIFWPHLFVISSGSGGRCSTHEKAIAFHSSSQSFFILAGTRVDLIAIFDGSAHLWSLLVIILAAIFSKQIGVAAVARLEGFSLNESLAMGTMHTARLSLIIAAAEIARKTDIINAGIYSVLVMLAVVTSTVAPTVTRWLLKN